MKKHSAVVEGVQSLTAQLQARQSESEELAIALRDKAQLVVQLQERVRVEELAELPLPCRVSCPRRHVCGAVGGRGWQQRCQALRRRHSGIGWLAVRSQPRDPQPERSPISDLDDDELWRRMNQASTVCGVVSDCGASTGQPSAGGSAESSTPTLAQSSTPSLGSHDDAKGKVKGAEGKDGQHTVEGEYRDFRRAKPKLSRQHSLLGGSAMAALSVRKAGDPGEDE